MTIKHCAIAAFGLAVISSASAAFAGANDYEFQPVAAEVRNGEASDVAVRLVNKTTGKPVEGAVVFRTRLDMSPEGMGDMTVKHAATASTEPGVFRYKADFTMAGNWALTLQAKVPGEAETVQGTVVFKAK